MAAARRPPATLREGAAPAAALFGVVLWLVATDRESFTAPLGYVGALTIPLLGGVMPMVLVVAGRRRGERVPVTAPPLLGNPMVALAVTGVFLTGVLIHGLVIWEAPVARAAALAVAAVMAGAIAGAWRLGAFQRRAVIELRREPERDLGVLEVTAAGRGFATPVRLDGRPAGTGTFEGFSRLREAVVELPGDAPGEVYVWAHWVSPDGESEVVPVEVGVDGREVVIRK